MNESKNWSKNKKFNKSKGGNRRRNNKKVEVDIDREDVNKADFRGTAKDNDKAWYNHFPDQVAATAHPSFADPTGAMVNLPTFNRFSDYTAYNITTPSPSVPGLCVLDYIPTIGKVSGLTTDYVNVALNRINVFLRRNLSSAANYDAADIGYYLILMDSIYQLFQSCCRAYGYMQNPKVYNRYMQYAIVASMGFNPQDLADNMADYRGQLNYLAHTLQQFCVPSGLDFISRHVWMCSDVYTDAESVKSQMYLYRLYGYYKLVEATGSTKPAYLEFVKIDVNNQTTLPTFGDWLGYLWDAVKTLMDAQDMIQISGDLLKAYGANNLFVVQPIGEDYILEPAYSREVLSQMENAIALGDVYKDSANITQSTDLSSGPNLIQNLQFGPYADELISFRSALDLYAGSAYMLNMHMDDVDDLDVMVATRLMYPIDLDSVETGTDTYDSIIAPWCFGTEVLAHISIYAYSKNQIPGAAPATRILTYDLSKPVVTDLNSLINVSAIWTTFDWAPRLFLCNADLSDIRFSELMDVDNYAIIDDNFLNGVHRTAVTSEWDTSELIDRLSKSPVNK